MARRTLVITVLLVLAQLSAGCCCCRREHIRERHALKHGAALGEPCACSCSSPAGAHPVVMPAQPYQPYQPYVPSDAVPTPKKMPAAGVGLAPAASIGFERY
jgi:hypothetical protein